mmetsp:Transcript_40587/g.99669  ORF Transcript_40587/g.99669 Transcript_40587/m.99669 type:complete len:378 (+) Transcript_40587:1353-2486(+)
MPEIDTAELRRFLPPRPTAPRPPMSLMSSLSSSCTPDIMDRELLPMLDSIAAENGQPSRGIAGAGASNPNAGEAKGAPGEGPLEIADMSLFDAGLLLLGPASAGPCPQGAAACPPQGGRETRRRVRAGSSPSPASTTTVRRGELSPGVGVGRPRRGELGSTGVWGAWPRRRSGLVARCPCPWSAGRDEKSSSGTACITLPSAIRLWSARPCDVRIACTVFQSLLLFLTWISADGGRNSTSPSAACGCREEKLRIGLPPGGAWWPPWGPGWLSLRDSVGVGIARWSKAGLSIFSVPRRSVWMVNAGIGSPLGPTPSGDASPSSGISKGRSERWDWTGTHLEGESKPPEKPDSGLVRGLSCLAGLPLWALPVPVNLPRL